MVVVFANLGVTRILCSFRIVLEGMAGNKISESSILEFSEGIPANNFCPIRCKDRRSQKLSELSLWEVIDPLLYEH